MVALEKCAIRLRFSALMRLFAKWELASFATSLLRMWKLWVHSLASSLWFTQKRLLYHLVFRKHICTSVLCLHECPRCNFGSKTVVKFKIAKAPCLCCGLLCGQTVFHFKTYMQSGACVHSLVFRTSLWEQAVELYVLQRNTEKLK